MMKITHFHGGNISIEKGNHQLLLVLFSLGIIAIGIYIRILYLPYISSDMKFFLEPWYHILQSKGFHAFKGYFSNYNYSYLYLLLISTKLPLSPVYSIKFISIVLDILLVPVVYNLLRIRLKNNLALPVSCSILLVPTSFLNSASWGQCDVIYAFFLVLSLFFLIKRNGFLAALAFSVAFCFKLQSVFILPAYAIILISKKLRKLYNVKLWYIFLPYFTYLLFALPALLAGASRKDVILMKIYFLQTKTYPLLTFNGPTVWAFFPKDSLSVNAALVLSILAISIIAGLFLYKYPKKIFMDLYPGIALFMTVTSIYLLPCMHERYFYFCHILSYVLIFYYRSYLIAIASICINIASFIVYQQCIYFNDMTHRIFQSIQPYYLQLASGLMALGIVFVLLFLWQKCSYYFTERRLRY